MIVKGFSAQGTFRLRPKGQDVGHQESVPHSGQCVQGFHGGD